MKIRRWVLLVVIGFCLQLGHAYAVSFDFSDSLFGPLASNKPSFHIDKEGIGLTVIANSLVPSGESRLYWDSNDGIGMLTPGYEWDEIEYPELLVMQFDQPVHFSELYVSDLFRDERRGDLVYDEIGCYFPNGDMGDHRAFDAGDLTDYVANNGEGRLYIGMEVNSIVFSAPGKELFPGVNLGEDHDFSIKGINVQAVPEPATLMLLGSGLVGLAVLRRKFRKS